MNYSTEELIALLRTRDAVSREAAKRLQELHDQVLEHGRSISHIAEELNRAPRRDADGMPVIAVDSLPPPRRDGHPAMIDDHANADVGC